MQNSKIKIPKESAMADHEANNYNEEEKIDRISDLPTSLISHILSFLPTREAAATSILSSSWRTLWTEVPDLQFWRKENDRKRGTRATRLCDVINGVFIRRKYPTIGKFRLRASIGSDGCDSINIGPWISAAVAGKIEALELSLSGETANAMVQLPLCLFTGKTIKVLKLCGCIDVDIPYSVHLPSLKILYLDSVRWGLDSDVRILPGCPVLEECTIKVVDKDEHPAIRVCVPSLKKLSIVFWFCRVGQIKMNTPSMEYLDIQTFDVEKYVMGDMKNLVEARLNMNLRGPPISAFSNIPEALCNVKLLRLYSIKTLVSCYISLYSLTKTY